MDFIFLHQGNNKTMQISVSVKTPLKSLTQTYKLNYVFSFNVLCFHFLMFFLTFFSPLNYHFIFNLLNCLFFSLFSSFISCFLLNSFFFLLFSALISFFLFFYSIPLFYSFMHSSIFFLPLSYSSSFSYSFLHSYLFCLPFLKVDKQTNKPNRLEKVDCIGQFYVFYSIRFGSVYKI